MRENDSPLVVALTADLLFASRIRAAADAAGVRVVMPRSADAAVAAAIDERPAVVLIDLDLRWMDPPAFITRVKESDAGGCEVVAFVSHVRSEAIHAARDAGADRVLARSAFVRELPLLLASLTTGG